MPDFQSHLLTAIGALLVGMLLEHFRSREWLKQEQWKYKREIYERLLHAGSDYSSLLGRSRAAFEKNLVPHEPITDEIERLLLELDRCTALAKVFASDETMKALINFAKRLEVAKRTLAKASTEEELRKGSDEQIEAANSLVRQLAETAKSDLEFR